jgi:signal transduction histidine kinase
MPIQSWRARVPDLQVLLTGPEETFLEDVDGVEMLPAPASAALVAAVAVQIALRVAVGRDHRRVAERERIEREVQTAAIRDSEARFAAAFRSVPIPLALLTQDRGRVLDANDLFLGLLGKDVLGLVGRTLEECGCVADPNQWRSILDRLADLDRLRDEPLRLRSGTRCLETRVSAEPLGLEDAPCILLAVEDQTERVALENQLQHSQKLEAVGQLAAGVAHDFNNLLTVIEGYTGLLLMRDDLPPSAREDVRKVAHASESASALTRKLLAFSHKQVIQPRPVRLNEHILALQDMLTRLIGERVELCFELGPGDPTVLGDPSGLEQVILNLALNARDAMPSGGVVTIGTGVRTLDELEFGPGSRARAGRFLELVVSDSGIGMSEEVRARIFEPFFTTKEPGKGTGLGLSTVQSIVHQHGGWIEVRSRPGDGTHFAVYFPLAPSELPTVRPGSPVEILEGGPLTILLVEDEESVRSYARIVLKRAGYQVIEAETGDSALDLWRSSEAEIGMVLTDMIMPGSLTGGMLAERLRQERADLPILFMSGYSAELTVNELVTEAVFLPKPFSPGALMAKVRHVLETRVR